MPLFFEVAPHLESRIDQRLNLDATDFKDPRLGSPQAFNIKILRVQTTYQFTPRLLIRSIVQRNTFNKTLDANVLLTYRVNSGTAFYVGYDDHYAQGDAINAKVFPGTEFERPTDEEVAAFQARLLRHGIPVMVRTTRGRDIAAACGQLCVEEDVR